MFSKTQKPKKNLYEAYILILYNEYFLIIFPKTANKDLQYSGFGVGARLGQPISDVGIRCLSYAYAYAYTYT